MYNDILKDRFVYQLSHEKQVLENKSLGEYIKFIEHQSNNLDKIDLLAFQKFILESGNPLANVIFVEHAKKFINVEKNIEVVLKSKNPACCYMLAEVIKDVNDPIFKKCIEVIIESKDIYYNMMCVVSFEDIDMKPHQKVVIEGQPTVMDIQQFVLRSSNRNKTRDLDVNALAKSAIKACKQEGKSLGEIDYFLQFKNLDEGIKNLIIQGVLESNSGRYALGAASWYSQVGGDIKQFQENVMKFGSPEEIFHFAERVKKADIHLLRKAILRFYYKNEHERMCYAVYNARFAELNASDQDIVSHSRAVAKTGVKESIYKFAKSYPNADIDALSSAYGRVANIEEIKNFIKTIPNVNITQLAKCASAKKVYEIALNIPGANLEELEEIILNREDFDYKSRFARSFGLTPIGIEKLRLEVIKRNNSRENYDFIKKYGGDEKAVEDHREVIIKNKLSEYNYKYLKRFGGDEEQIERHRQVVIDRKNLKYNILFAKHFNNGKDSTLRHQHVVEDSNSLIYIILFASNVEDSTIDKEEIYKKVLELESDEHGLECCYKYASLIGHTPELQQKIMDCGDDELKLDYARNVDGADLNALKNSIYDERCYSKVVELINLKIKP